VTDNVPRYGGGSRMHGPEADADAGARVRRRSRLRAALLIAAVTVPVGSVLLWARVVSSCACIPSLPPPPESAVGVVVAIDQVSLTEVRSFDLRLSDGKTMRLNVGALDNATQFSLSHLATHMATGVPIRALYRRENGEPVVYHLEDAVPASASPAAT
jgi:hypothetical protein